MMRPALSTTAYTSESAYDVEQNEVFGRHWSCVGVEGDMPDVGDTLCAEVGPHHLLVVRDQDGALRAHHNLCRHRGTRLLTTRGKRRKTLVCPYHRWTYGLDGSLQGMPDSGQFPGLDKTGLGLHPASVATWKGLVFVHPEPQADPLDYWLGTLPDNLGPHGADTLVELEDQARQYEVAANWKLFVENAIDGYHLRHLHAETLTMYDHRRQRSRFEGRHWTFAEPATDEFKATLASTPRSWLLVDPRGPDTGNRVHLVFPNLVITESESDWSLLRVLPEGPGRTRLELRVFAPAVSGFAGHLRRWFWQGEASSNPSVQGDQALESGDFMLEDLLVCERQQQAMSSPRFAVGPLASQHERDIVSFQRQILAHLDHPLHHQARGIDPQEDS